MIIYNFVKYIVQTLLRLDKIFYKVVYHHIISMCDFLVNLDDFFAVVCMSFHSSLISIVYIVILFLDQFFQFPICQTLPIISIKTTITSFFVPKYLFKVKKSIILVLFTKKRTFIGLTWCVASFRNTKEKKKPKWVPYCLISFYSNIPHPFSPTWPHCPHTLPCMPFWTKATLFYNNFIIQLPTT